MPVLPLTHVEPVAATFGTMLYPGTCTNDRKRALAFAAHFLAGPLKQFHEGDAKLGYEQLLDIATDAGERLDDLDKRWWGGTATGEIFKTYFILAHTEPKFASWSNSIKIAEIVASQRRESGSRSGLQQEISRFKNVAHLWGAWAFRNRTFTPQPEIGYDGVADFHAFLTEAEILRDWGQSWRQQRKKADPPLPEDVWRVPDDWRPPPRREGWPDTGKIPHLRLPEQYIDRLRPAGRPKTRS